MLTVCREVVIGVPSGVTTDVFDDVIHEDPDGMSVAVLLRLGGELAALDHPVER